MENNYGNLPPTPLLKKKSLVESFARKQKRNTLGGPGGLAPVGQPGSGDALLLVPKQQSLAQVVRQSHQDRLSNAQDANSPPLVRVRRRAESEPPPYSPAWGKKPRRRVWHEQSVRPALPLDMAILLGHVPTPVEPASQPSQPSQPRPGATSPRALLLQPSVVTHATLTPIGATANPLARVSTTGASALQPASRPFAQHAQASHSNSHPSSPHASAGSLTLALTSASVAQFFDAQKGSFQKLGNDKKSLKESKLTLRINDTSRGKQNNEDTLKRTMTIHSLLDSLSNVNTLSKSCGHIPPQPIGSLAHSTDGATSSAPSVSPHSSDLFGDVMEMSRQARKERSKRLQLRQSIFAGSSVSLPTALGQPGNALKISSSNLVAIPTQQQTATNERERVGGEQASSTSERETRDRNRGSCAREKPWGGIHLFNSESNSSNASVSAHVRRERGPADLEATTGSCNEREDNSSHSLADSGGALVPLNQNRSGGDGETESHSSSSSTQAYPMPLQHSPSHSGNRARSSMPLRQSGSNVLAAMARESGERDSSNTEFTPGQASASHVPPADGISASSQPASRSNSTNSSTCLPDLANKRHSGGGGGIGSRSNSNSSIPSSPKQSPHHHSDYNTKPLASSQHHVAPSHVTPFVIAGRSKQSVARHPSVDSDGERGHDGETGADEPTASMLLSAERSPRGNFLSNRRESSAQGSNVVSRERDATTTTAPSPISIPQSLSIDLGALEAASAGSNSSSLSPHSTIRDMQASQPGAGSGSIVAPLSANASLRGGLERREASVTCESGRKAVQQSASLRTVGRQQNFTGTSPRSSASTQSPPSASPGHASPSHLSASTPAPHVHNARSLSKSTPTATPSRQLAQTMGPQTLHGTDATGTVDLKSMSVGARKKYYSELEFAELLKDDILVSYFRAYLLKHDTDNAFKLDFMLEVVDMKLLTNPNDVTNKIATIKKTYFSPGARTFLRGVDSEPILNPKPTFPPAPKNTLFDGLVVEFQSQLHCVEFQSFLRSKVMDSFLSEKHGGHATHGKLGGSHKKSLAMKLGKKEKGKTITADDFTLPPSLSTASNYAVPRLMLNPEELECVHSLIRFDLIILVFTQQIIAASEQGKFNELRPLLQQKEATLVINDCNTAGVFALYVAARGGFVDCLMALLSVAEVNVNQRSPKTGDTALHVAVECDQFDLIALLLYAGAKPLLANKQGLSARQTAKGRTVEVFSAFDGIGETGRFKKLYPIIKRFEEFNLHSSQPPTPSTPTKRSISRSYTTSGNDRPTVASPRDYFKNPFSPRKADRLEKAAEKQQERELHRSESNNPKLERAKSVKDKNRDRPERERDQRPAQPLEREHSSDRRERDRRPAKLSRGEKDYASDSASSRPERESESRAERASSQRERGLPRTPTKHARDAPPRLLSLSCLNRTLAVAPNDDEWDSNFLDFLEKEFGQRLDFEAVSLRNQAGEAVPFNADTLLRAFAHEGAIYVDVLGLGKRDAIDGEAAEDEAHVPPLAQDTIDDFCAKCWQGDLEGFYAFFRNPAIDQRRLVNALNSRGQTALYCACRCGHAPIVVFLLRHPGMESINVLSSTSTGKVKSTALHAAGFAQHADIVALLLARGASIDVKNDLGLVPKQEAFDKETRKASRID